jgi:hypothetical protein
MLSMEYSIEHGGDSLSISQLHFFDATHLSININGVINGR